MYAYTHRNVVCNLMYLKWLVSYAQCNQGMKLASEYLQKYSAYTYKLGSIIQKCIRVPSHTSVCWMRFWCVCRAFFMRYCICCPLKEMLTTPFSFSDRIRCSSRDQNSFRISKKMCAAYDISKSQYTATLLLGRVRRYSMTPGGILRALSRNACSFRRSATVNSVNSCSYTTQSIRWCSW